jgi:hypothetical protein
MLHLEHQPIGVWTGSIASRRLDSKVDCLSSSSKASKEQGLGEHGNKSRPSDLLVDSGESNRPVAADLILPLAFGHSTKTSHQKPDFFCTIHSNREPCAPLMHAGCVVWSVTGPSMATTLPEHRSYLYRQWLQPV